MSKTSRSYQLADGPGSGDGWERRRFARERDLESEILVPLEGQKMIDDGEIGLRLAVAMDSLPLVDRASDHRASGRVRRYRS